MTKYCGHHLRWQSNPEALLQRRCSNIIAYGLLRELARYTEADPPDLSDLPSLHEVSHNSQLGPMVLPDSLRRGRTTAVNQLLQMDCRDLEELLMQRPAKACTPEAPHYHQKMHTRSTDIIYEIINTSTRWRD